MARILLPLSGLLILAATVALFVDMPGEVLITWRDLELATSVAFMTGMVGTAILFTVILFESLRVMRAAPQKLKDRKARRRESLGLEALTNGLLAVASGNADDATRYAESASRQLDRPALTLLLNAQTAQLNNDGEAAERHFKAMLADDRTVLLGYRGLIAQANRDGDTDKALTFAREAVDKAPKGGNPGWLNALLFELETKALNWTRAEDILSTSLKARQIDADDHKKSRGYIKYQSAMEAQDAGNIGDAIKASEAVLRDMPLFQPNVALLASLLLKTDKKRRAQRILQDCWAVAPHPLLAEIWNECEALESPEERLTRAKRLTERNPGHVESYIYIAGAALQAQSWDRARLALQEAYEKSVEERVCALRADLEARGEGNDAAAREWRYRAEAASKGAGWICDNCDQRHDEWQLHCGGCATFGALRWRDPIQVLPGAEASEIVTLSEADLTDMPHILEDAPGEAQAPEEPSVEES